MKQALVSFAVLLVAAAPAAAGGPDYAMAGQIAGPDGRWDYARVDPAAGRLYVARGDSVTVIDLASAKALPSIGSIVRGHSVVPIDGTAMLLVTSGGDDSVRLLDTHRGVEVARIAVGANPDAALYDKASGNAYVMNAKAGTVSVIDVARHTVSRTITLKPGLEFAALANGTLYVNNEDASEIETASAAIGKPGAVIAMPGCEGPSGLAYDARSDQLIAACANGKAAVIRAKARAFAGLLDIGKGSDAVIMDEKRRLAFVPCGRDGTLIEIDLDAKGGAAVAATIPTEAGARTGALDPRDGALYLPTAKFGAPDKPSGRPQMIAGTFHAAVVRPR